jgi:hypothetical protein
MDNPLHHYRLAFDTIEYPMALVSDGSRANPDIIPRYAHVGKLENPPELLGQTGKVSTGYVNAESFDAGVLDFRDIGLSRAG